jgi:hypothetical protein
VLQARLREDGYQSAQRELSAQLEEMQAVMDKEVHM